MKNPDKLISVTMSNRSWYVVYMLLCDVEIKVKDITVDAPIITTIIKEIEKNIEFDKPEKEKSPIIVN